VCCYVLCGVCYACVCATLARYTHTQQVHPSHACLHHLPVLYLVSPGPFQNLVLWRRYQTQRRTMAYPNELFLFHGTGSLPPAIIYSGVEGFDPRCTGTGRFLGLGPYYGLGAYFAENAAYSDGGSPPFAYQTGTPGVRQMFLAQVLCGRVKDYGKELMRGLKRPPLVEGSHRLLYDSVQVSCSPQTRVVALLRFGVGAFVRLSAVCLALRACVHCLQGGPHTSYGGGPSVMHVVYTTSHS
jgi:hypothetical protein